MFPKLTMLMIVCLATGVNAEPKSPLVSDGDLQAAGMSRYWEAHLPIAPSDSLDKVYRVDEALYITTDHGVLYALTADTGLVRWAQKVAGEDHTIYPPSHIRTTSGTGPTIVTTTTTVLIYDRYSGALIKSFEPTFAAGSAAVADGGVLFMGSAVGRFYSLQLASPDPFRRWEVLADGPVTTTPILYDRDKLLFVGQNGTVYSCVAWDKTLNWRIRPGGTVMTDAAVDESGVYLASLDRSLYKVGLENGRLVWRVRLPNPLTEGPVAASQTVYQYCVDNGLSAIDAETGTERWRHPEGRTFVAHSRGGDLVLTVDRRLVVVDHESGEVLHVVDAQAVTAALSNTWDDAAYMYSSDGRVLCVRLDSVPYLRRQQVLSARQGLNRPPEVAAGAASGDEASKSSQTGRRTDDPLRSRRDDRPD